jgi:hypothetical protein
VNLDGLVGLVALVGIVVGCVVLIDRVAGPVAIEGFALRAMVLTLRRVYALVAAGSTWMSVMALWGFVHDAKKHGFPIEITAFTTAWWGFGLIVLRVLASAGTPLRLVGRSRWIANFFLGIAFLVTVALAVAGNLAAAAGLVLIVVLPGYLIILLLARRSQRATRSSARDGTRGE